MKTYNAIYVLVALVVLGGAVLNILHLVESNYVVIFGLIALTLVQSWYIKKLKDKILDLENAGLTDWSKNNLHTAFNLLNDHNSSGNRIIPSIA